MNAPLTLLKAHLRRIESHKQRIEDEDKPPDIPPHTSADAVKQSGKTLAQVLRVREYLGVGIKVRIANHREYRYTPKELAAIVECCKTYVPKVGSPGGDRGNGKPWTPERRAKFEQTIAKRKARRRK